MNNSMFTFEYKLKDDTTVYYKPTEESVVEALANALLEKAIVQTNNLELVKDIIWNEDLYENKKLIDKHYDYICKFLENKYKVGE